MYNLTTAQPYEHIKCDLIAYSHDLIAYSCDLITSIIGMIPARYASHTQLQSVYA